MTTRYDDWTTPKQEPSWQEWRERAETLASHMDKIAKISHKSMEAYWENDPRSDEDKLHAILNEAREALYVFKHGKDKL